MMNNNWTIPENLPLLDRAMMFAVLKHSGQLRKGTTIPYITHVPERLSIRVVGVDDNMMPSAGIFGL